MAKVLRLHSGANDTITHWGHSDKIGTNAINSIIDPQGADDKHEITSIPSPFARIDLAKRAFKYVTDLHDLQNNKKQKPTLNGNTAYHKIVSDCLDVGQIFFNIGKYKDQIEIIEWVKKDKIDELKESQDYEEDIQKAHKRLGKTLDTYLEQDGQEYNFDNMTSIYLLNYKDPSAPKMMNIIGATSPATLFFSSANNLEYVGDKIKFGNDKPFDNSYAPLYSRDEEYILYWYRLRAGIHDFARKFPEIEEYLKKCVEHLKPETKQKIQQITTQSYTNEYDKISVGSAQNYIQVLGSHILKKKSVTNITSGFTMAISQGIQAGDKIPLALPVETYSEPIRYTMDNWNRNTKVPFYDETEISQRTLPDDGSPYPYVTIGDFLEDTIIKNPYKFNNEAFFDGNNNSEYNKCSFILPLTKTFFRYFTANDLINRKVGGKNMIEIKSHGGAETLSGVSVTLRIPIQNERFIEYERVYTRNGVIDRNSNKGAIVEKEFTLGLFPNIAYPNPQTIKPYYRVAFLDRDGVSSDAGCGWELSFFTNSNNKIGNAIAVKRNNNNGKVINKDLIDVITYVLEDEFSYINVESKNDSHRGVIIPHFKQPNGNHAFRFAIDFGTTNTHIEYGVNYHNEGSIQYKAFDITKQDAQIQKLHISDEKSERDIADEAGINVAFDSDFIPSEIGKDCQYSFPMRTVLSEGNNTNWNTSVFTMAHVNIPFAYEKNAGLKYNNPQTDLKWTNDETGQQRAIRYIESILIMLRNKVLLNNGDPSQTEIVWFYPASMTTSQQKNYKKVWTENFVKLFGAPEENILAYSESIAPYNYNAVNNGAGNNVVSIDIGGGTTDVFIVGDNTDGHSPKILTSFRFAANALFGDGYRYKANSNGFVQKYKVEIENILDSNQLSKLKEMLNNVIKKDKSSDVIAFFFSLANNKDVLDKNITIDFGNKLSKDRVGKYAILLFFVAIMYHIANLMKAKGFGMPRHMAFSGNGSKVLNILFSDNDILKEFVKIIFVEVYGESYPADGLDIIHRDDAKESTCKGGMEINDIREPDYTQEDLQKAKTMLLGTDSQTLVVDNMSFSDITEDCLGKVVNEIERFIDFTFKLNNKISFYDMLDIDTSKIDKVKELCNRDILTFLKDGISRKQEDIKGGRANNSVEETLFFYPLIGIINALVRNIYKIQ